MFDNARVCVAKRLHSPSLVGGDIGVAKRGLQRVLSGLLVNPVARGELEAHLGRALVLVRLRGLVGCYKHLIGGDLIGAPGGGRR